MFAVLSGRRVKRMVLITADDGLQAAMREGRTGSIPTVPATAGALVVIVRSFPISSATIWQCLRKGYPAPLQSGGSFSGD